MVIVTPDDAFISFDAKRKFGWPNGYGVAIYSWARYGYEDDKAGIYQTYHGRNGLITVRKKFYAPLTPMSTAVHDRRAIFRDGVLAWQSESPTVKKQYDHLTYPENMSGFNRYLRLYLLSH